MSIISLTYLTGCLLYNKLFEKVPRKLLFVLSFVGFIIALLLMGPSEFLSLPKAFYTVIGAYPLLGFCQIFVFIPIIPEMIERVQDSLGVKEGESAKIDMLLSDAVNEAYVLIYAISAFLSPLIGGCLYMIYGMRKTCDIVAAANLVYVLILISFNCGFNVYKENVNFNERRKSNND